MTVNTETLIIGGGISGLLTARELILAGHEVTVVDKSAIGQESSWAGGGILLPIYPWRQSAAISDLVLQSIKQYPLLNSELLTATGIDPEWRDCGMLICQNPDFDQALAWCQQRGVAYQAASSAEFDGFNSDWQQPLWLPEIAQIRNPRLLKSLIAYLRQLGVKFVEHADVRRIVINNHQVEQVETAEQRFKVKQLVVTTGAWMADFLEDLLPQAGLNLPIKPVKGQMLLFDALPETLDKMVLDGDRYLIPRRDGKILAGSTVEDVGFDKTTNEQAKQQLYQFAIELMPDLKRYPVCHHWAGLRPGSPQGIPYIGLHPQISNLAINVGHFRNGLVMGPASAKLLADLMLERSTELNPEVYALVIH